MEAKKKKGGMDYLREKFIKAENQAADLLKKNGMLTGEIETLKHELSIMKGIVLDKEKVISAMYEHMGPLHRYFWDLKRSNQ